MVEQDSIRFRVEPRDVPAKKAARHLHLTEAAFQQKLVDLYARGFPRPDPTTGMFDLKAIDTWMDQRHGIPTSLPNSANDNGSPRPSTPRERIKELNNRRF